MVVQHEFVCNHVNSKGKVKGRAAFEFGNEVNLSAKLLDDHARDDQTEADALGVDVVVFDGAEQREQLVLVFLLDSNARVVHRDPQLRLLPHQLHQDRDLSVSVSKLHCVLV